MINKKRLEEMDAAGDEFNSLLEELFFELGGRDK